MRYETYHRMKTTLLVCIRRLDEIWSISPKRRPSRTIDKADKLGRRFGKLKNQYAYSSGSVWQGARIKGYIT